MSARETLEVLYLTQWRAGNALKIQLGLVSKLIRSLTRGDVKLILWCCCFRIKVKGCVNQTPMGHTQTLNPNPKLDPRPKNTAL